MVLWFEDFLNDDNVGVDGVDDDDIDDEDDEDEEGFDSGEIKDYVFDEVEFEKVMNEMMGMLVDEIEKSGFFDEVWRLVLEDVEEGSDMDEDEEMKKVMEFMEKELKGYGVLDLSGGKKEVSKIVVLKKKV